MAGRQVPGIRRWRRRPAAAAACAALIMVLDHGHRVKQRHVAAISWQRGLQQEVEHRGRAELQAVQNDDVVHHAERDVACSAQLPRIQSQLHPRHHHMIACQALWLWLREGGSSQGGSCPAANQLASAVTRAQQPAARDSAGLPYFTHSH